MMKLKRCSVCRKEVPWLIQHAEGPLDQLLVTMIERNIPGGMLEDGICLPCFDQFKKDRVAGCYDIRIFLN